MSENKSDKQLYVISKKEVEQYYEFCESYMEKTRLILKDYSDDIIPHSVKAFGYVCDINAQCLVITEILGKYFPLDDMEYEKPYKVDIKVATSLVKTYLGSLHSIQILKSYGVHLENN